MYFRFGRYRGRSVFEVPVGYLLWALEHVEDLDPELRAAIEERVLATRGDGRPPRCLPSDPYYETLACPWCAQVIGYVTAADFLLLINGPVILLEARWIQLCCSACGKSSETERDANGWLHLVPAHEPAPAAPQIAATGANFARARR